MKEKHFSNIVKWNGFKIACVSNRPEFLEIFKKFYERQKIDELPAEWRLLADRKEYLPKNDRTTWLVENEKTGKLIFKRIRVFRKWDLDHCLRDLRDTMLPLVERTARAHADGFTFPMLHFLVAERRKFGMLRETYLIFEFIKGTQKEDFDSPEQWLKMVTDAHRYGICWHGDARIGNFMVDENGTWRGIDFYSINSIMEYGRDISRARQDYPELKLPESFSLKLFSLQEKIRKLFGMKVHSYFKK